MINLQVITIPAPYKDPDECIRVGGSALFKEAINNAEPYYTWRLNHIKAIDDMDFWVKRIGRLKKLDYIYAILLCSEVAKRANMNANTLWEIIKIL